MRGISSTGGASIGAFMINHGVLGCGADGSAHGWGEDHQWRFARKPSDENLFSIVKFRGLGNVTVRSRTAQLKSKLINSRNISGCGADGSAHGWGP